MLLPSAGHCHPATHRRSAKVASRDAKQHKHLGGEGQEQRRARREDRPSDKSVAGGQPERHSVQHSPNVFHLRGQE